MSFCSFVFSSHNKISGGSLNDILDLGFGVGNTGTGRTFESKNPSRASIIKLFDILGFCDDENPDLQSFEITSLSDVMPSLEFFDSTRDNYEVLSVPYCENWSTNTKQVKSTGASDFNHQIALEIPAKECSGATMRKENRGEEDKHETKLQFNTGEKGAREKEKDEHVKRDIEANNIDDDIGDDDDDDEDDDDDDDDDADYDDDSDDDDYAEAKVKLILNRPTYDLLCKHFKDSKAYECLKEAEESHGVIVINICNSEPEVLNEIIEFKNQIKVKKIYGELKDLSEIEKYLKKGFGGDIVLTFHETLKYIIVTGNAEVLERIQQMHPNYFI